MVPFSTLYFLLPARLVEPETVIDYTRNVDYVVRTTFKAARDDFRRARQQAAYEALVARWQGQSNELLSYYDVYHQLRATGQSDRGLQEIPLTAIVGSVGRTTDFSRTFLPRNMGNEERWAQLLTVVNSRAIDALPPIQVYQIGEAYFVQDGHHRVSIARRYGLTHIHAHVTQVDTLVPIGSDTRPDDLIWRAEYAQFLADSRLHQQRPEANLSVSIPGQYAHLEAHVEVHRYFQETAQERDITWEEAVVSWYDAAYLPLVGEIRAQAILRDFPGRTETDLYLWLVERQMTLQRELAWEITPATAAVDLARQGDPLRQANKVRQLGQRMRQLVLPAPEPPTGQWRQEQLLNRYSGHLFNNILTLINGSDTSWPALEQAFVLAGREQARLRGLWVNAAEPTAAAQAALIQAFEEQCFFEGVPGDLAVAAGDLVAAILQRAAVADLIVLALPDIQERTASRAVSQRCQRLLRRAPCPTLVVTGDWSNLSRPLLIYDDSDKSREALFAAGYMGERWGVPVAVIAAANGTAGRKALNHARTYLDMHEVAATFHEHDRLTAKLILDTAASLDCDFLISGSYRSGRIATAVRGSRLNDLLQQTSLPLLICR
jgi:nucleotide-binding universal stress UspA family protein